MLTEAGIEVASERYNHDLRPHWKLVTDSSLNGNDCNLGGAPISPEGVWKARVADAHSRDIFFVSMARSMAIPARIFWAKIGRAHV